MQQGDAPVQQYSRGLFNVIMLYWLIFIECFMRCKVIDWDDAKYALTLSREGTIRATARVLKVNPSTVSRRINQLEKNISTSLFEATPCGFIMTEAGRKFVSAAMEIEVIYSGMVEDIQNLDDDISGNVYVEVAGSFTKWVCEKLTTLYKKYPKLNIQLSTQTRMANMDVREADIVLRVTDNPPENMVGRCVARLPAYLYVNQQVMNETPVDVTTTPWVRWGESLSEIPVEQYANLIAKDAPIAARVDDYFALTELILAGAGIGFLCPCFFENKKEKELIQIQPDKYSTFAEVWMLTHPKLRGVKRVSVITKEIENIFKEKGLSSTGEIKV